MKLLCVFALRQARTERLMLYGIALVVIRAVPTGPAFCTKITKMTCSIVSQTCCAISSTGSTALTNGGPRNSTLVGQGPTVMAKPIGARCFTVPKRITATGRTIPFSSARNGGMKSTKQSLRTSRWAVESFPLLIMFCVVEMSALA